MADEAQTKLSILIEDEVWQKVMHWIDKSPVEVSGLGKVEYDEKLGLFRVIDAFLVEQENTGGDTEMKDAAVAKLMYETYKQPGRLCWWWHSHVNMNAFWSGIDQATIEKLGGGGWVLATVLNKKREYRSAYYQAAPNRFMVDNLPTAVGARYVSKALLDAWNGEYDSKVKEKKSQYAGYGTGYEAYAKWLRERDGKSLPARGGTTASSPARNENVRRYGVDFVDEAGDEDAAIKAHLRRLYLKHFGSDDGETTIIDPSSPEGQEILRDLAQADGDPGHEALAALAGLGIDQETGAVTHVSSDDGPEPEATDEELGYEMLPYEQGDISEEEIERLFAEQQASSDEDPDEISVDPRDGDATEMDALDLMNHNIDRYNRAHKKFSK